MNTLVGRRQFLAAAAASMSIAGRIATGADAPVAPAAPGDSVDHIRVGTAKVDITPTEPRYNVSSRITQGSYHPIHARCLTLYDGRTRLAIVTYDLNSLDVATPILRERAETELGISPDRLVLLATHNHQAPLQLLPPNFDYGRMLAEKLFGLIKSAIDAESGPADLLFGFGHCYYIRSELSIPADYEVQVLKVAQAGRTRAILFNHPTHPLAGPPTSFGPSHPGYAMDALEEEHPGALALYADACGGNQYCPKPAGVSDDLTACRMRGLELADVVRKILTGPLVDVTGPIESKLQVVDLPLAEPIPLADAERLAKNVPLNVGLVPGPNRDRGTNWIRQLLRHYKEGLPFPKGISDYVCTDEGFLVPKLEQPRKYPCRFNELLTARIGKLTFMAIQGEVCGPIGMRIKDVLRHAGPTMLFAYMGERNLYIPTREHVRQDAYQAQVLRIQYASPVGWSPDVEDEMVKRALAAVGAEIWVKQR
jgi:neutral ceramidase